VGPPHQGTPRRNTKEEHQGTPGVFGSAVESWNIAAKRKKLWRNEMQRLAGNNVKALNGNKESNITYIVPTVSEEMNGTFKLQERILAKELGIEDNGECDFELYRYSNSNARIQSLKAFQLSSLSSPLFLMGSCLYAQYSTKEQASCSPWKRL
jgi:hypothetical protein